VKTNLNNPLVSIVDDDQSIREAMESLLTGFGFRVLLYSSAEEFLSSSHLNDTSGLVLDISMAGMSGLELQRHLAARPHQLPIIFLTAHGSKYNEWRAKHFGATAFLRKPFASCELLQALCSALNMPQIKD
jgi:FixJ family two-component response regulator